MTLLFLLILTLAWLVIFFPSLVRVRRESPLPAAESFKRCLELLAPRPVSDTGRWVLVPETQRRVQSSGRRRALRRRIRVLKLLLGSCLASGAASIVWADALRLHVALVATLALYIAFLVGSKRRRSAAVAKIEPLPVRDDLSPVRTIARRAAGGVR